MKSVSYEKGLIERLKDPEYASVYLTEALNDGDQEVIRIAFQDVIKAKKEIKGTDLFFFKSKEKGKEGKGDRFVFFDKIRRLG